MATAVRCFALFPPLGEICAETPAAPGLGDEGATGPGLGDTEPGVASGWEMGGLAGSNTEIHKKKFRILITGGYVSLFFKS